MVTEIRWETPLGAGRVGDVDVQGVLPAADTEDAFGAVAHDESALRPGVDALARSLGLDVDRIRRLPNGSLPVYATEDVVLKLFPPVQSAPAAVETGVLRALAGRLPVPSPAVHADGVHDGWTYVVMDRLPGVDLSSVWAELTTRDRRGLTVEAGALTAALHEVEAPTIAGWWPQYWPEFVADQRSTVLERNRRWGLPEQWLGQLEPFLDAVDLPLGTPVLLHTEVMPANLLAARDAAGRWRLSGVCDVEPAMRGSREYDLVAVAVFMAGGDAGALRDALLAYGYPAGELDGNLSRRLLAWTLLHRFGNLSAFLDLLPPPPVPTLEELAVTWFGLREES